MTIVEEQENPPSKLNIDEGDLAFYIMMVILVIEMLGYIWYSWHFGTPFMR